MCAQNEFSSIKLLLKQVYSVHATKVKELENEIKFLKEKLEEKNGEITLRGECKRCSELEEAFKTCKKALNEQSKCLNKFGQKFSIFNSLEQNPSDTTDISVLQDVSGEKKQSITNSTFIPDQLSKATHEICVNQKTKGSKHNMFKKIATDSASEIPDVCTVTFPEHANPCDSLIFVPDSFDTHNAENENNINNYKNSNLERSITKSETSKASLFSINLEKNESNESSFVGKKHGESSADCMNVANCKSDCEKVTLCSKKSTKDGNITCSNKTKCNKVSSDVSNADTLKTQIDQVSLCLEKSTKTENFVSCFDRNKYKRSSDLTDADILRIQSEEATYSSKIKRIKSDEEKIDVPNTCKTTDSKVEPDVKERKTNFNKCKIKCSSTNVSVETNKASPSLLPATSNTLNLKNVEVVLNDDDFQETASSSKPSDDTWESCDKKKSSKQSKSSKHIKCTSKYKMTLNSPPPNFKKPNFRQMKLSKSIFQPKQTKSLPANKENEVECLKTDVPEIIFEGCNTSTPEDDAQPSNFDIDATFIPDNFNYEITQCGTANVKKIAIEKKHTTESLFSNISFPGVMKSPKINNALRERKKDNNMCDAENNISQEDVDNSFDKLPVPEEPKYKYKNDTVRKKSERKQLDGFECKECEKYYSALGISEKEMKNRMKKCSRHRAKYAPPETPEYFWELEFPDTEECKARGYLNETQKVHLKSLNKLI